MEDVLVQVSRRLRETDVVWGLGGSLLLKHHGLIAAVNDIDVLVAEEQAERAHRALADLGPGERGEGRDPSYSRYFYQHQIGVVSLDLMGGYRIRHEQGMYEVVFDADSLAGVWELDGERVPLSSLEDWYVIYQLLPKKREKAALIAAHWREQGVARPDLLRRALSGELPDWLRDFTASIGTTGIVEPSDNFT